MTKDQMVVDLAFRTKVLLWSGVALGSLAIGVLGYAAVRYCGVEWIKVRALYQNRVIDCYALYVSSFHV